MSAVVAKLIYLIFFLILSFFDSLAISWENKLIKEMLKWEYKKKKEEEEEEEEKKGN